MHWLMRHAVIHILNHICCSKLTGCLRRIAKFRVNPLIRARPAIAIVATVGVDYVTNSHLLSFLSIYFRSTMTL